MSSLVWGCGDDDDNGEPIADAAVGADASMQVDAARSPDGAVADSGTAAVEVVNCQTATPDQSVDMANVAFDPAQLTIAAGEIVEWTNLELEQHTVTSGRPNQFGAGDLFDSGILNQNDTFCLRFNEAGAFQYYCLVHPDLMDDGTVTVQ